MIFSYNLYIENPRHLFLTYLTKWSYILLGVSAVLQLASSVFAALKHEELRNSKTMPVVYQVTWFFYSAATSPAVAVTLMYWALIYNGT